MLSIFPQDRFLVSKFSFCKSGHCPVLQRQKLKQFDVQIILLTREQPRRFRQPSLSVNTLFNVPECWIAITETTEMIKTTGIRSPNNVKDTPSLRSVVDFGVWFASWNFLMDSFVDFSGLLSLEKQGAKIHKKNIHDFEGNFLTRMHSG